MALRGVFEGLGRAESVSTDEEDLREHGVSEWSYHEAEPASVVVWAERCVCLLLSPGLSLDLFRVSDG